MSKKDYEMIARVISRFVANDSQRALLALELGYEFQKAKRQFDMDRWLKACNCGQQAQAVAGPRETLLANVETP